MARNTKPRPVDNIDQDPTPEHINLSPELNEAIGTLRPEQRNMIIRAIRQESFSGPLPHPELMSKYEQIQPGFAERIISMAEHQQDHRIDCERKIIDGSMSETRRGQWLGFSVALLFLGAATALGLTGHDWLGGVLGGGTLVALVTVFVKNGHQKNEANHD